MFEDIDRAEFFDPEEFSYRRGEALWPMSGSLVPIPRRDLARAGLERLPSPILRAGEAAANRWCVSENRGDGLQI
ncbi:MAG: hypothetical protein JO336_10815 [Acidobacteriia bacterium]|nr:hypothetical protein [Terriglobia bacterium]